MPTIPPDQPATTARPLSRPVRLALLAAGWLAVGIGMVNLFLPGLPGTVFFVIAAWCFARSSPRFERWLLGLPVVGQLVADYRAGLGMPMRAKVVAVTAITVAVGVSVLVLDVHPLLLAGLAALGVVGVWVILARVPTRRGLPGPRPGS
jgi:uncharacterized membrane protein YbaN (DUF454 family)